MIDDKNCGDKVVRGLHVTFKFVEFFFYFSFFVFIEIFTIQKLNFSKP